MVDENKKAENTMPKRREKFDMLVAYGAAHTVKAPDHAEFNAPGCIACWMVRNLGAAIIMIDTVITEYENGNVPIDESPFLVGMRDFLSDTDEIKGIG